MKTFEVWGKQTIYTRFIVKAKDKEEAINKWEHYFYADEPDVIRDPDSDDYGDGVDFEEIKEL